MILQKDIKPLCNYFSYSVLHKKSTFSNSLTVNTFWIFEFIIITEFLHLEDTGVYFWKLFIKVLLFSGETERADKLAFDNAKCIEKLETLRFGIYILRPKCFCLRHSRRPLVCLASETIGCPLGHRLADKEINLANRWVNWQPIMV